MRQKEHDLHLLSLFSGSGGMDLGFEGGFTVPASSINENLTPHFIEKRLGNGLVLLKKNRFSTVFANDILASARHAWTRYFSQRGHAPEVFHADSIVDLVKRHRNGEEVFPGRVDVVTGGFPCQDFSVSGRRRGFQSRKNHKGEVIKEGEEASVETRGQLYMWMREVVGISRPKVFIAENVKGLVNLSNVKEVIRRDFSSAGGGDYLVLEPKVLHAADYGVPQSRERVIFIGLRRDALRKTALRALSKTQVPEEYDPYPRPTHAYTAQGSHLKPFVPVGDLFPLVQEPQCGGDLSQKFYSQAKFMGAHCQGQTEIKPDGLAPTIRAEHHGNIEFRRLSIEHGGMIEEELRQGLPERRLTPRECALIQTFPLDYEFVIQHPGGEKKGFLVSPSQAYKIIGNAVPPLLAYHLAQRLEEIWDRLMLPDD